MNFLNDWDKFKNRWLNERGSFVAVAITTAVVSGGYTAYSQYQQGAAQKKFANYQAQQEQVDADQALAVGQAQSEQVAQQGELNSQTLAFKNAQEIGKMRAAESANGISSNSVTAENLEVNSFNKGNRDEQILNYNEQNKEWSYKTNAADQALTDRQQSSLDVIQGENEQAAGEMNATGTLLSTASTVAGLGIKAGSSPTGTPLGAAGSSGGDMLQAMYNAGN